MIRWTGADRIPFIESLIVSDIESLPQGSSTLTVLTNEQGGIIDDAVVNKQDDHLYVVSNAGCSEKDLEHIRSHLKVWKNKGANVDIEIIDTSLIALQGPSSVSVLESLLKISLSDLKFMSSKTVDFGGVSGIRVTRCGYTGEDGFEISVPHSHVTKLSEQLLNHPDVEIAGLGARDSLRLEAGLCLYGHDLGPDVTPVEAGLVWTIGKRRRSEKGFLGADRIVSDIATGPLRRRVGLIVQGAPAREGSKIFDVDGNLIGAVTSGIPSPTLKKNISMGYVKTPFAKAGTDVFVKVREKLQNATITKMPFVPHQYYRN